jgi:hypothetical protein
LKEAERDARDHPRRNERAAMAGIGGMSRYERNPGGAVHTYGAAFRAFIPVATMPSRNLSTWPPIAGGRSRVVTSSVG